MTLKRRSHEIDLTFDDMHGHGQSRPRGQFFNFFNAKGVFLAVNESLRWLKNARGVYFVQGSLYFFSL